MSGAANDTIRQLDDTGDTDETTSAAIMRLRRLSYGIGIFWQGITYVFLALILVEIFAQQPALLTQPRGWAIIALSVVFGAWYYVGFTWLLRANQDTHWQAMMAFRAPPQAWRGFVVWAVAIALNLSLTALDGNFKWMLWSVYGVSFTVWPLPYALALFAPTAFAIFATQGWLPTDWQPMSLVWFAISVALFCIYTATAYLPFILLRGRFERERMFADLETSHRALAEAHRQLEAASARDRELAALHERGRIARDMHDTLGHSLALIAVKLDAAQRLRAVDAARADHEIAATQAIARAALAELRAALAELRAALPQQTPLGVALARTAREAGERAGWRVTYEISPDLGALDEATYAALLRVGAEALTNAERHAHAHNITLALTRDGCDILLRVKDDGVGVLSANLPNVTVAVTRRSSNARVVAVGSPATFSVATGQEVQEEATDHPEQSADSASETISAESVVINSPQGHYGVIGMRERIAEIGGRFSIGPAHDGATVDANSTRGTVVEARVPTSGF